MINIPEPILSQNHENKSFKYFYKDESYKIQISNEDIVKPKVLFKYYGLNKYSVDSIKKKYHFFSHPYLLNDLYDSRIETLISFEKFIKKIWKQKGKEIQKDQLKIEIGKFKKNYEEYYQTRGTFSLSEDYQNDLMWAHYTSENGFCVEYDIPKLLNSLDNKDDSEKEMIFPVNYKKEIIKIDVDNHLHCSENKQGKVEYNLGLLLLYCYSIKESSWSYEKEWRILIK